MEPPLPLVKRSVIVCLLTNALFLCLAMLTSVPVWR